MKNYNWLFTQPVAHRGLHNNIDMPENSLIAFSNAVSKGYAIELDVYFTDDQKLIVHHDETLIRSCKINAYTTAVDSSNLQKYRLFNTNHRIPLFEEVLQVVDGKVGLIIEIKKTKKIKETCIAIRQALSNYKGEYCIESFDPFIVKWWLKNCPNVTIGQLYDSKNINRFLEKLTCNAKKVDFWAVNVNNCHHRYFQKLKSKHPHKALICWTVRTQNDLDRAQNYCDNYIFEINSKNPKYIAPPPIKNK